LDVDFGQVATVIAVLVPAATAIAQLATLRERVNRHDRSIENFGQRFEREKEERAATDARILEQISVIEGRRQESELSRPYQLPREPAPRPLLPREPGPPRG
jgi:hypothetical protein